MTRTDLRAAGKAAPVATSVLSAVRVVLYEPQDPVNIAATIRAMKNMGCSDLYLVRSVEYDPWRLEGIAHDTGDIIARIRNCDAIEEALAGRIRVAGSTAGGRAARRAGAKARGTGGGVPHGGRAARDDGDEGRGTRARMLHGQRPAHMRRLQSLHDGLPAATPAARGADLDQRL